MVKNPKNKGNAFERVVAKYFTDWAGVKFMRTPSSGAIHNFKDKRVVSDIVPPLSIGNFPFSIECKNVNCNWEFAALLEGTSPTLNKHWEQCITDADREGLLPLLVFTKNFRSVYIMMRQIDYERLNKPINPRLTLSSKSVVIMRLCDFLDCIDCEYLLGLQLI